MKKWVFFLCCLLVIAVVAFVIITRNNNSTIDSLNKDLFESRTKINDLEGQAAENEKKIQELDNQVKDLLTGRDQLVADNGRLTESLDTMTHNLSSSQQKLQGILYILTDGEQGAFDGVLSPFMKIYGDAGLDSPYFAAVDHVTEHKLMAPVGEETFGAAEKATLGEFALGWAAIRNLPGEEQEALDALLNAEKTWLSAQAPAEAAATEGPAAEATAPEEPAAEVPATEEPAAEAAVTEEPQAEEAATEEPAAEEPAAEETVTEEPAAEAAATEAPAAEETPAEDPAAEAAVTEEPAAEETPTEEPAAEAAVTEEPQAEEPVTEEPAAEDGTIILTRERLVNLCKAVCFESDLAYPEIVLPESTETDANRGDLAIALTALDQIEK